MMAEADALLMPPDESVPVRTAEHPVRLAKSPDAFKTISEVAELLEVPTHVLRFWESKFREIHPLKLKGGRRYYRPADIEVLTRIKDLLYAQGYTIKGAQQAIQQTKRIPLNSHGESMSTSRVASEKNSSAKEENQLAFGLIVNHLPPQRRAQLEELKEELSILKEYLAPYV